MTASEALRRDDPTDWGNSAPEHWSIAPLGTHFDERSEIVSDRDFEPLSVTMKGIVPRLESAAKTTNNDTRKLVRRGDFVINSRSDRKGSAGISEFEGSVSVVYTVLTPRPTIDGRFAHHLLRSTAFQEEFFRWGNGIVADLWSTRYSAMKRIPLALPPLSEQLAIADYLDRETAQIDTFIEEQRRLIDLLVERRRAVIDSALSDGIGGEGDLHQTGNPWLPDLPGGWQAVPTKRLILFGPSNGVSPEVSDLGDLRTLSIGAVRDGQVGMDAAVTKWVNRADVDRFALFRLRADDILIVRGNGNINLVARAGLVGPEFDDAEYIYPDLLMRVCVNAFILPEFFVWAFNATATRAQIESQVPTAVGTFKVSGSGVREVVIPLPSLAEQRNIVAYLRDQTSKIDALVTEAERFIELAQERRSALITAAVTGQIDLREMVA